MQTCRNRLEKARVSRNRYTLRKREVEALPPSAMLPALRTDLTIALGSLRGDRHRGAHCLRKKAVRNPAFQKLCLKKSALKKSAFKNYAFENYAFKVQSFKLV